MSTPRDDGCRWPAEWEPHRATWLVWPHNADTWPGRLAGAEAAFVEMVRALHGVETVAIAVGDEAAAEHVRRTLGAGLESGVELHRIASDDSWVRDTGPVFLHDAAGAPVAVDFGFDAWGRKYPPWDRDAAVARRVAGARGVRRYEAGFVLEGGSVEGNGAGTVLTTASCLLHPNREAGRTRETMEERLRDWLCAERVLWLGDGIEGDDTDGHVDDLTRFVGPTTVVTAVEPDPSDPNHRVLDDNLRALRAMGDGRGGRLQVATLPMPPALHSESGRCPASYANFYLANRRVLVPVFAAPSDARALRILAELLPDREVAPIPARDLVHGLGAVHCLTQQEPAPRDAGPGPHPARPGARRLSEGAGEVASGGKPPDSG